MICSLYCTVTCCHAIVLFPPTSIRPHSPFSPEAFPFLVGSLFILQRHNKKTQMHLNINADTNDKCPNEGYNIETEYMFTWNINSWSIIHRPLFLFIHFFYNLADVWRANHNMKRGDEKGRKLNLTYNSQLTAAPYCINSSHLCTMPNTDLS